MLDVLRAGLDAERSHRAESLFRAGVAAGRIQFRLRVDRTNYVMLDSIRTAIPSNAPPLLSGTYQPLGKSLFEPVYADDYSSQDERNVAIHLDGEAAVMWWHRNGAKAGNGLQGWQRQKIYPDFIFAASQQAGANRIVVLETKGDHLAGNVDTSYKTGVMQLLTGTFDWERTHPAGGLELVDEDGTSVQCEMVLMSKLPTELPRLVLPDGAISTAM